MKVVNCIMTKSDNKQRKTRDFIKNVLGEVPLTAELYWLIRNRSKGIQSRFSLTDLDKHIPEIVQYLCANQTAAEPVKKNFGFCNFALLDQPCGIDQRRPDRFGL